MIYHCLFEQSGTFKNEFKKLGFNSYDYDILNDFGETDFQIDLFKEIEKGYLNLNSIFDKFVGGEHFLLAFFPCIRFENQIKMHFKGTAKQLQRKSIKYKLEYDLKLHKELSKLYELITKLVIICINKKIPLIIENPYSTTHYLTQYWALDYTLLDSNRFKRGDYFKKPTQYWFINCEPKNNFILESIILNNRKQVNFVSQIERSLISKDYANRFIREFIIEGD